MALSFAHDITPKPLKTPHSTMDPLTGRASLKTSYIARKRFRCWRRTYFGKFSSLISVGSAQSSKIRAMSFPTSFSAAVRNVFTMMAPLANDGDRRLGEHLEVGDQRALADVLEAQAHFLGMDFFHVIAIGVGAANQDFAFVGKPHRRVVGHSRRDAEHLALLGCVEVHSPLNLGSWANETHFPPHHVDQLW